MFVTGEGGRLAGDETDPNQIQDDAMHRQEPLRVRDGRKLAHLSLASPRGLMRDCRSSVFVLPSTVHDGRHHGAVRRSVAEELVRDQTVWHAALSVQQCPEETCSRTSITPGLDEDVHHVTVRVDGPPEILPSALNSHEQLIQKPRVAHPPASAPQPPSVVGPKCLAPVPNRLVGDGDASLGEQVFCIAETQAEAVVQSDGVTDDGRGKSVSAIAGRLADHQSTLPPGAST